MCLVYDSTLHYAYVTLHTRSHFFVASTNTGMSLLPVQEKKSDESWEKHSDIFYKNIFRFHCFIFFLQINQSKTCTCTKKMKFSLGKSKCSHHHAATLPFHFHLVAPILMAEFNSCPPSFVSFASSSLALWRADRFELDTFKILSWSPVP